MAFVKGAATSADEEEWRLLGPWTKQIGKWQTANLIDPAPDRLFAFPHAIPNTNWAQPKCPKCTTCTSRVDCSYQDRESAPRSASAPVEAVAASLLPKLRAEIARRTAFLYTLAHHRVDEFQMALSGRWAILRTASTVATSTVATGMGGGVGGVMGG